MLVTGGRGDGKSAKSRVVSDDQRCALFSLEHRAHPFRLLCRTRRRKTPSTVRLLSLQLLRPPIGIFRCDDVVVGDSGIAIPRSHSTSYRFRCRRVARRERRAGGGKSGTRYDRSQDSSTASLTTSFLTTSFFFGQDSVQSQGVSLSSLSLQKLQPTIITADLPSTCVIISASSINHAAQFNL